MVRDLQYDEVELCKQDVCIKAKGENARLLVRVATVTLLMFGVAALIKAANSYS